MRFSVIRTVFIKELREMLRDRRSLAIMFGLPLVLYPMIAIGVATLASTRRSEQKQRVAQVILPNEHEAPQLEKLLTEKDRGIELVMHADPATALKTGRVDAILNVPLDTEKNALAGEPVQIGIKLDRSRSTAPFVEERLKTAIEDYQRWIIEQRLKERGIDAKVLEPLKTALTDVATKEQSFGRILAQMLPLLLLMTGMLGALFPALNATTTERELGTLETLLVTPAGRTELLVAKGGLVLVCGLLTAGLNMLSMSLVMKRSLSLLQEDAAAKLSISPTSLALVFLAAVPALVFFTTIVLIVGLLARNFREANAFATPVMLLPLASLAVGIMEPAATPGLLVTPVANTTIIIRDVLTSQATIQEFVLAFVSSAVYAGLMLSLAARLFSNEQLVNPAWEPLSLRGFRRSKSNIAGGVLPRRLPAVDEAIALFCVVLLLFFYITPSFAEAGLLRIVVLNQLVLILGPVMVFGIIGRWNWRDTLSLRPVKGSLFIGAALIGVGLVPWVLLLSTFQQAIWPRQADDSAKIILKALMEQPILTVTVTALLAGIFEELLFRGPIQRSLLRRANPWVAISITALLFAGLHFDLHGMPVRFGLGVLLGWIVWRTGSIFPAMILHALYDGAALGVAAFEIHGKSLNEAMVAATGETFHLDGRAIIQLAVGAGFLIAGAVLIRPGLRRQPKVAEVEARGFAVAQVHP